MAANVALLNTQLSYVGMVLLKFVCRNSFLLLLMLQLAAAIPPIARPGCPDHCGNISIAFPFGIGTGCYLDSWFEIECNETSNQATAFIRSIKMEVLNISVEDLIGVKAAVKSPIISSNCSGRKDGGVVDLTRTPFYFSLLNGFTVVGCNIRALMTDIQVPRLIGCTSTCRNTSKNVDWIDDTFDVCYGSNCCQVPVDQYYLQVFHPSLETENGNLSTDGCKMAALVDRTLFFPNKMDLQNEKYAPMALAWMINYSTSDWRYDNESTMCAERWDFSSNRTISASMCMCNSGYEGNAYLETGCIDIDECKHPDQHSCRWITKCVNRRGSYTCEVNNVWIIFFVAAAAVGILSLFLSSWWLYRKNMERKTKFFKRNGGLLLQQQLSSSERSVERTKIFSSKELEKATDGFNKNRILGQGGQGTVYKGMLADGRIVAVKKSTIVDEGKLEEFINEVVILSQINHRNVVRLLGCCLETEVPLLVYEFIPNGNLFQYLHDRNEEFLFSWEMRLRIAFEVAGALSYLHSAALVPIFHRDIKSTNILLDEKYRAKVADFGASKSVAIDQTHQTTNVQGTFGYLDPEYFQSSQLTAKSDVYSFGVVLVELLSGQKPISWERSERRRSLATHFILLVEESRLFDILDVRVKENCHEEEVIAFANLARRCLNANGKNRPTMREVFVELERIRSLSNELNGEQNNEEMTEIDIAQLFNAWDAASTSVTHGFDDGKALSLEVEPLLSFKTW